MDNVLQGETGDCPPAGSIYTDQGVTGQGEATDSAIGGAAIINGIVDRKSAATMGQASVYFGGMRNSLIGQDPLNVDYLWERLRTAGIWGGAQGGQYVTAMAAVESALWDLTGKTLGLPAYQLLGGKMRDRIRMYCEQAGGAPQRMFVRLIFRIRARTSEEESAP